MNKPKQRNNILITGASSGLGEGMARFWGEQGRNLALCARRLQPMQDLAVELSTHGGQSVSRQLDVCDHDAVFRTFAELDETMGGLDRVIVNAGIGKGAVFGAGDFAANLATAQTNYIAAMAQIEAALQLFRKRDAGHLVLIASVAGYRGFPGKGASYSASKAAVAMLGESLLCDYANSPINITVLNPGYILTAINEDVENAPFRVSRKDGVAAMVKLIDAEVEISAVPRMPWSMIGGALKRAPRSVVAKIQ